MSHNIVLGGLVNEFSEQFDAKVMPWAGTNLSRAAGVQFLPMFNVFMYWPTGHFGQDSALGIVQDPSGLMANGSESLKKVPGLQQNTRFPGGKKVRMFFFDSNLNCTTHLG